MRSTVTEGTLKKAGDAADREYDGLVQRLDDETDRLRSENAALTERCAKLEAALTKIAMINDKSASDHLASNGSYSWFDEPESVATARTALAAMAHRYTPPSGVEQASASRDTGMRGEVLRHSPAIGEYAVLESAALRDQIAALTSENAKMRTALSERNSLLTECLEFIEEYEDVRDGSDGVQLPNAAMSLCTSIKQALGL